MLMNLVEIADEFITSQNIDLRRIFIIKPTHSGWLKKHIWIKKTQVGTTGVRRGGHCAMAPHKP